MENYSLSDIANVTGRDGFGGSNSWVLIILFALIFGWGGNGFGNRSDFGQFATSASQSEILLGQQFQGLDNKIDRLANGICDSTYALNNSITGEGRNIQMQLAQCCCDNAKSNAELQNLIIAENGKTREMIQTNKIESLQNQINQLQLQSALCGVVKYPNATTYTAGNSCFTNNGCGCNTGI